MCILLDSKMKLNCGEFSHCYGLCVNFMNAEQDLKMNKYNIDTDVSNTSMENWKNQTKKYNTKNYRVPYSQEQTTILKKHRRENNVNTTEDS